MAAPNLTPPSVPLPGLPDVVGPTAGTSAPAPGGINSLLTALVGNTGTTAANSGVTSNAQAGGSVSDVQGLTTVDNTQQTGTVQAGTTASTGATSTLSQPAVSALQKALLDTTSSLQPANLSDVKSLLSSTNDSAASLSTGAGVTASGELSTLNQQDQAIVNAQQSTLQQQLQQQETQLAEGAGTSFNSVIQDAFAKDVGLADVQLAGLQASLLQTNAAQATAAMTSAITDLNNTSATILQTSGQIPGIAAQVGLTQANSVAALANALKGGVTTSTSDVASVENTQQTINSITQTQQATTSQNAQSATSASGTVGTNATSSNPSLLDLISSLAG